MAWKTRIVPGAAFALLLIASLPAAGAAPPRDLDQLTAKELAENQRLSLPVRWSFHPSDDPAFAAPGFDDSSWREVDARFPEGEPPPGWTGVGWFRLRVRVDPGLSSVPLGLLIHQFGAAEIYLDGRPLLTVGTVGTDPDSTVPRLHRRPHQFSFDAAGDPGRSIHVFAVRFCNHQPQAYEAVGKPGGFVVTLGDGNREAAAHDRNLRTLSAFRAFFPGVFAAFALLHLLLFAFYRESTENLYFALLASAVAVLVYVLLHGYLTTDPRLFQIYDAVLGIGWLLSALFGLRFVYSVFHRRLPRQFWAFLAAVTALAVPVWLRPLAAGQWISLLLLLASVEMVRTVITAIWKRKPGAWIVGCGILTLVAGTAVGLLADLGALPWSITTAFLIPASSVIFLILSMSIYLSRKFAHTSRELRQQLRQVEELSAAKLEQEVDRRLLEAKYQRKLDELEEARQLQLSMLPERLPEMPELEIAAGMFTATEVGGDYYDFDLADDGTLTVAIGDATGHGLKAGTLVTATKSLFHALDRDAELPQALERFGRALKRMNLRQLNMALMLARFKDGHLRLAAAGMPPALVYRAAAGEVESVLTEGIPLGSLSGYPYQQKEVRLAPGDTVLLMSDGFPERLNGDAEMLGYEHVAESFSRLAPSAPETIIEGLVADGDAWASGRPPEDDTTFVVLKMRAA